MSLGLPADDWASRFITFIEFNPRLEAIHFLATAAGMDTVRMTYDDLGLGRRPASSPRQHAAAAWIGSAWAARLRSDPTDWRLAIRDRLEFGRFHDRARAVLSWSDPVPAACVGASIVSAGVSKLLPLRRERRGG